MYTNNKIVVINDAEKSGHMWCKVCEHTPTTFKDSYCLNNYDCCEECWLVFGQSRQKDWEEGWRPDSETLNRYKQSRRIINIDIMKILGE